HGADQGGPLVATDLAVQFGPFEAADRGVEQLQHTRRGHAADVVQQAPERSAATTAAPRATPSPGTTTATLGRTAGDPRHAPPTILFSASVGHRDDGLDSAFTVSASGGGSRTALWGLRRAHPFGHRPTSLAETRSRTVSPLLFSY